ncbi:MAG: 30S ribosomal protein S12 methylthiotransferase RimO [Acidobacteria bacterium]|nr:30S ribosomal protein S12 methylthiotransferase RimO [Acidobacteriota bacterium]
MSGGGKRSVKVGMVSLGCPKNTVDSEVMLGHLGQAGATLTRNADEADVVVINTCGFIDAAKEESVDTILAAVRRKEEGLCRRVVVTGCMVQRYGEELRREIPEIDAFVDLDGLGEIARAVGMEEGAANSTAAVPLPAAPTGLHPATYLYDAATPRTLSGPSWSAYLKIAEGCDNTCSFCAIPRFRGAFRSRPLDDIVREARNLAAAGIVELNLIAQDSTAYGGDLGLREGPTRLVEALADIQELKWVRLFYVYPNKVDDSLLHAMGERSNIAAYIDIPLQHAARSVLARMRRGGSASGHLRLLERIRRFIPGVAIRSTVIVGFPGETETEFQEVLTFIREARFDHLGAFTYSHEDHTTAAALDDDVPAQMKEDRRGLVMAEQEAIASARNGDRVGSRLTVLCEGTCLETEYLLQGRLEGQAPEVDGRVLIQEGIAKAGQFVQVEITEAHPYDLVGRVV